jgi:hypothetical protein
MSNKPHLRPHQKKRQASRITRLLVATLFITIFALATALAASGRVLPHGRFIPLSGAVGVNGDSGARPNRISSSGPSSPDRFGHAVPCSHVARG